MPLFESTIPVSQERIAKLVAQHWGLTLGALLKESQNHTFLLSQVLEGGEEKKYILRVTPDPKGHHKDRISREAAFVGYLTSEVKLKYACGPIPTKDTGEYVVIDGDLVLIVSEFARGEPLDYFKPRWMSDKELVHAWGKWFALLHQASR